MRHIDIKQPRVTALDYGKHNREYFSKKNNLSVERFKKLYAIGFLWNIREDPFEKGFTETLRYKNEFGDPNAPHDYKTSEGYPLGQWQVNQRRLYGSNKLSLYKIKIFEIIGLTLDFGLSLEEKIEIGFEETLRYKEEFGDSNASYNYETPEGAFLGDWQKYLRQLYKKGELPLGWIKKFEEIGNTVRYESCFDLNFSIIT